MKLDYLSLLNEAKARQYIGSWAKEIGWGGISRVNEYTGKSMDTIRKGIREIESGMAIKKGGRLRKNGGGRKSSIKKYPTIIKEIENILNENTRGDFKSKLHWTNKSTRTIANELKILKWLGRMRNISEDTVEKIMNQRGYLLQTNNASKKILLQEKRNSQFKYINKIAEIFANKNLPLISIDIKRGKRFGNTDSSKKEFMKRCRVDEDNSEWVVGCIKKWWEGSRKKKYPYAKELLIFIEGNKEGTQDKKAWKLQLQKFVDDTGPKITVSQYPIGTRKWKKLGFPSVFTMNRSKRENNSDEERSDRYELTINPIGEPRVTKRIIMNKNDYKQKIDQKENYILSKRDINF